MCELRQTETDTLSQCAGVHIRKVLPPGDEVPLRVDVAMRTPLMCGGR